MLQKVLTISPNDSVGLDQLPSPAVGVFLLRGHYPYPEVMLSMDWCGDSINFTIDVVLPRESDLTDQIILSITEPLLLPHPALASTRASRLCRFVALGLTTTIPSTISIPAHCSSDQESYSAAVIC